MDYQIRLVCGKEMVVVTYLHQEWLIGGHVAHRTKRETFNLYRSMKARGMELIKLESAQVQELIKLGVVQAGTRSVTLTPYHQSIPFIETKRKRNLASEDEIVLDALILMSRP